jgi:RNA polymerase sigma factor (sigma-70 family)
MATAPTASSRLPPFTERGLLRAAARGEQRAFEQIYKRYHQQLYRYCFAILRRSGDAEDALQATMAAALRALPGETREVSLRSWLFRVAHNESITLLRARARSADPELAPEPARQSVEAECADRERFGTLLADLGELPERQRSAIVMRELSGLSYEEIAAALGCSEGAARQIVYESRVALQIREEGRAVSCEEIRKAISDGDRRRLRGRKLKAHLSACEPCRDFERGIGERQAALQAFCPILPAAAAAGIFSSISGGGAAGGGVITGAVGVGTTAGAGAVVGGLGGGAAVKGLSVLAAVVAAAGIGEATGTIDVPVANFGKSASEESTSGSGPAAPADQGGGEADGKGAGTRGNDAAGRDGKGNGQGQGSGGEPGRSKGKGANGEGRPAGAGKPESTGKPASPGNSAAAPGLDGSPGNSGSAGNSASAQGAGNRADAANSAPGSAVAADPPTGSGSTGQPASPPAQGPQSSSPGGGVLPQLPIGNPPQGSPGGSGDQGPAKP